MIASLTGPDMGPIEDPWHYSDNYYSYWHKRIISSTSNKMLVEFRSDDSDESQGFYASIHYSSKECEAGLDMTKKTIQSPNFPDLYCQFFQIFSEVSLAPKASLIEY